MRSALTAGSMFAVTVMLGFLGGLGIARAGGSPLWVVGGLFAGVAAGGILAARALLQAGK